MSLKNKRDTKFTIFCLQLFYRFKQSFPADAVLRAKPYQRRFAHNVRFGHKAPVAAILASVPVIAHHPIIIVFKCIAAGRLAVYNKLPVTLFQDMSFVAGD